MVNRGQTRKFGLFAGAFSVELLLIEAVVCLATFIINLEVPNNL